MQWGLKRGAGGGVGWSCSKWVRTNGSKPGWPRLFPPTYLQRQGVPGARVGRGGCAGAVLPRFGAFFGFFSHFWRKAKDPLPRESNPRLPPYFAGGVTKIPGPWSCCRETGPEPPGSGFGGIIRSSFLSGSGFGPAGSQVWPLLGDRPHQSYPRACKSGAYPRKKAGSAGIGLRPGPRSGKVSAAPTVRPARPDLCLKRRLVFGPDLKPTRTLPPG